MAPGKTTTIHMILGLISPTSGEVRIFGQRFEEHRQEILEQMNFTSPYVAFPVRLTVFENLMVFARMYNLRDPRGEDRRAREAVRYRGAAAQAGVAIVIGRDHARRAVQGLHERSEAAAAR